MSLSLSSLDICLLSVHRLYFQSHSSSWVAGSIEGEGWVCINWGCGAYMNKLRLYLRRWRETKDPLKNFDKFLQR